MWMVRRHLECLNEMTDCRDRYACARVFSATTNVLRRPAAANQTSARVDFVGDAAFERKTLCSPSLLEVSTYAARLHPSILFKTGHRYHFLT
jgi:hypothetical protein